VDLSKVLAQLRLELENLDLAIASLERLAAQKQRNRAEAPTEGKRRGRPPKAAAAVPHAGIDLEKRSK
jgi:hypothetical protein